VTDTISLAVPADTDWDAFYACMHVAFGGAEDTEERDTEHASWEPERAIAAWRDGEIVGTSGVITRRMAVPGAALPVGHVTAVSVRPTARRHGLMSRMMRRLFDDIRAAGEPVAALWATEGRIYQRFGYGLGALRVALTAKTREAPLLAPASTDRLRESAPAQVRELMEKVYDEAYQSRPGWSARSGPQWDHRLADLKSWRGDNTSELRAVVHDGESGPDGYLLYRMGMQWDRTGPNGTVKVLELVATTGEAYSALWQLVLTMDLTRTAEVFGCATDEPLLTMVTDPSRLAATVGEALWIRLVDLPAALAARRYAADIDVVLEVTDAEIPANAGRWRLSGSPGAASCTPTTDDPDLRCDVRILGAAYLGRTVLHGAGRAGLVEELRPGALTRAAAAFDWYAQPSAIEVF
jgi:predicted acetyltransferase